MRHNVVLAAILVASPLAVATGTPSVHLHVPPPGRYGIEDLWKATVISDTACDAWFEGFVFEATKGQVFWAKTKTFALSRGTRVYQYKDVTVEKTDVAQGYEAFVTRTGSLPYGSYSFKLVLMPFNVGDLDSFEAKPMGPPRLILPRDGAKLPQAEKYPVFGWTPPQPPVPGVKYAVRVAEILPGQTKEEAIRANKAWYEGKGVAGTTLRYPMAGRAFAAGKHYAWQVRALREGLVIGESEVRTFITGVPLGPLIPMPPPLRIEREIERNRNFFTVTLTIENQSGADMHDLGVSEQTAGLQYVAECQTALGASGPFRDPVGCDVSFSRTLHTKGSRLDFDWGSLLRGRTLRLRYQAVPVLFSRGRSFPAVVGERLLISYRAGARYYSLYFDHLADSLPADTFDRALRAADYLELIRK